MPKLMASLLKKSICNTNSITDVPEVLRLKSNVHNNIQRQYKH